MNEKQSKMDLDAYVKSHCIGITGGIACGKTTVSTLIRSLGFEVLDADQISRKIVAPGTDSYIAIVDSFGKGICNYDKTLNRSKLKTSIMNDKSLQLKLESITHPAIQNEFYAQASQLLKNDPSKSKIFFYDAALIFETKRNHLFKEIWVIHCPETIQIQRLMRRDHLNESDAQKIISMQMPVSRKMELADELIDTNCTLETLHARIQSLIQSKST